MDKIAVKDFFDHLAPTWDADMIRNEDVISYILDTAGVDKGISVLDVACGTGVLFGDYIKRGVESLTAIDISPKMVSIAKEKYPQVEVICGDAEQMTFSKKFDAIVIYNAFPHFPSPKGIIESLCKALEPNGRLTIAHGMSRQAIIAHHAGAAADVSLELPEAKDLAMLVSEFLDVDVIISDDEKYIVSGTIKAVF